MKYLIRQGDYFWRPNRCGYAGSFLEAGIYDEPIHSDRLPPDRSIPIVDFAADLEEAEENVRRFRAALYEARIDDIPKQAFKYE